MAQTSTTQFRNETGTWPADPRDDRQRRLIGILWLVAIVLGALQAWSTRHSMDPDGLSYLDMGDAWLRGDWRMAINAYWSPLYAWLLGLAMVALRPSPYWEFSVVHLVNFAIYVGALGCFHFFMCRLIRYQLGQADGSSGHGEIALPEWAWLALGYTLFIWASLDSITLSLVTPDLCVAAFVYLAAGILVSIGMGSTSWRIFILLGVVLGLSYLAKAAMFPLAFIFLGVSMFSVGNMRTAVPRVLIALAVFIIIGSPFIIALSQAKGRLTFGDSAKLNYAWFVNRVLQQIHWQGNPSGSGIPKHPTRKIFDAPAIYEFGAPIGGTYPPWYDPSYWHEGIVLHFNLKEQLSAIISNIQEYYVKLYPSQSIFFVVFVILFAMSRNIYICLRRVCFMLIVPSIVALAMYSLVYVSRRYICAFLVLLWIGIGCGMRLAESEEAKRLLAYAIIAIVVTIMITVSAPIGYSVVLSLRGRHTSAHAHWQVANGLNRIGVQSGDKVAVIGESRDAYWARLARVRIVAEIPQQNMETFWAAPAAVKSQVMQALADTGAKIVVTTRGSIYAAWNGWQEMGETGCYAYILRR
jgi:hypothetical protein